MVHLCFTLYKPTGGYCLENFHRFYIKNEVTAQRLAIISLHVYQYVQWLYKQKKPSLCIKRIYLMFIAYNKPRFDCLAIITVDILRHLMQYCLLNTYVLT